MAIGLPMDRAERRDRTRLDRRQERIRLIQDERARRRGVTQTFDPS